MLNQANAATVDQVVEYIHESTVSSSEKLQAGLICAGANISAHGLLFNQISRELKEQGSSVCVVLSASECSNLKSLLKALISRATATIEDDEEQARPSSYARGPKLLNYDLQLLYDYVKRADVQSVVVAFQDTEAFDAPTLSDAIQLFSVWHSRIPFVLLFGIATSVDSFQDRLSRVALRSLQGREFDVVQSEELLEQVFLTLINGDTENGRYVWLGPELISMLMERQKDHVQNVTEFVNAVQVRQDCKVRKGTELTTNSTRTCAISLPTWPFHSLATLETLILSLTILKRSATCSPSKGLFDHHHTA